MSDGPRQPQHVSLQDRHVRHGTFEQSAHAGVTYGSAPTVLEKRRWAYHLLLWGCAATMQQSRSGASVTTSARVVNRTLLSKLCVDCTCRQAVWQAAMAIPRVGVRTSNVGL